MIYTLESQYNQGLYIQWIEAVKRTGLPFENLVWNLSADSTLINFPHFLEIDDNINRINSIITNQDSLLIDSAFIDAHDSKSLEYYQDWNNIFPQIDKINAKQILIFHPDTGFENNFQYNDKIKLITPMYNIFKDTNIKGKYNFYLFNSGYSHHRWLANAVFDRYIEMVRYKKFLSNNGYLKPHRTLLYHLLKKDNLLDQFFYSNIAYNVYDRDGNYCPNEEEISYENQMLRPFPKGITDVITPQEYDDIIKKDLPIFMDYSPLTSNVDQYAFTLPYTCNSYIEVICATNYGTNSGEHGEIYTSEKIFKAFVAFQIPMFLGKPLLCKTLQELGFHLFEDLIDLSYDEEEDDLKRILMFHENIKKISEMSNRQLHHYYVEHRNILMDNFYLLKHLSNMQIEHLKNLLQ